MTVNIILNTGKAVTINNVHAVNCIEGCYQIAYLCDNPKANRHQCATYDRETVTTLVLS